MERATGIEPVLPAWEGKYSALYFQHLQNRSLKICMHAAHTVHALPDLRIAAGRSAGRFLSYVASRSQVRGTFPGTAGMVLTASGFEFVTSVENRRSDYKR